MNPRYTLSIVAAFSLLAAQAQQLEWAIVVNAPTQVVATATAVDGAGAVITVGYFISEVDLDPGPGTFTVSSGLNSSDIYMQKLDANGQFLWGGSLGSTGADVAPGVAVDADDNIILTGKISGTVDLDPGPGVFNVTTMNGTFDALVLKLDASGNFLWGTIFGSNGNDGGMSVATDAAGNIHTTGFLGTTGDIDPGPGITSAGGFGMDDVFVQQLDPAGNFVRGFAIGSAGNDIGNGIAVSASGRVYVTGDYNGTMDLDPGPGVLTATTAGSKDIFMLKLDPLGDLVWGHHIGGNSLEVSRAIAVSDMGMVITGQLNSVTDMDPGPGVAELPGSGFEDAFLLKLDTAGNYQWAFLLSSFLNIGTGLAVDAQGNVVTCGSFGGTLDIDPGPAESNLVSNGASDAYLISYDAAGALRWGFNIGSFQNDGPHGVAWGSSGPVVMVGEFRSTMDADPGAGTVPLVSLGGQSAFTTKYAQACEEVAVSVKAWLDGAYREDDLRMVDSLRVRNLLPLVEPYTAMGFPVQDPMPASAGVLDVTGDDAIVDWILVELRDADQPSTVLATKAALLQRDGDVVDVDGTSPVNFCGTGEAAHVALRHRNHLAVMTAGTYDLSGTPTAVDLTDPATITFGLEARKQLNGAMLLWSGNVAPDAVVKYTGAANDRDPIIFALGGLDPTAVLAAYHAADVNMDGDVKYTGQGNDRDLVLLTVGGLLPTAVQLEQLP